MLNPDGRKRLVATVITAVLALLGGGLLVTVAFDDGGGDHPATVTVTVQAPQSPGAVATQPKALEVPTNVLAQAEDSDVAGHAGARGEAPPGMSSTELEANREKQEDLARSDQLPLVTPEAAPSTAGCTSQFVRNFSSRRGVRPRLIVIHYTVSRNVTGWADVNAITALFDRSAFQASSNYVYDFEGHCAYIVRESDKAWTQAAANPFAISFEVVAMGDEGHFVQGPALTKLGGIIAGIGKRWDIPLQRGASNSACVPTRAGIVQHADFGSCGGGHHDIQPFSLTPIVNAAKAANRPHVTSSDRAACVKVHAYRLRRHAHKPKTKAGTTAFERRLALVRARGLKCVDGKARVR